ncbi:MAG: hypothetical protein ABSE53_09560 [Terracidiphilus sp.]|jgi:hypothetical protein
MGKSKVGKEKHEQKSKVVTMPRTDGGEDAEAGGNGEEKDAAEKPGRGKATETIEKEHHKGASKALRHAVKKAVKESKGQIADSLVTRTVGGDMHCAAFVMELMEKKKKDGEDDDDWDGPGLADILVPGQLWREKTATKQTENEEGEKTEAA